MRGHCSGSLTVARPFAFLLPYVSMPRRSRPHHRKLRAVRRTAAAAAAVPPAVDLAAAAADVQEPPLQTGLQKRLHLLQLPQEAVLQTAADEKRFIDVKTLSHIGSLVRCSLCDHQIGVGSGKLRLQVKSQLLTQPRNCTSLDCRPIF